MEERDLYKGRSEGPGSSFCVSGNKYPIDGE